MEKEFSADNVNMEQAHSDIEGQHNLFISDNPGITVTSIYQESIIIDDEEGNVTQVQVKRKIKYDGPKKKQKNRR